ncbi:hypothetical protein PENTCL1PPCAC_27975, partial [Pristionchus entomophagus]
MRLTTRISLLLLLLAVGSASAQSKDDEESVDTAHNSVVEGSGNAPSDDEDTVEGSGLPPSQVYTKLTTIVHARPAVPVKPTTVAPESPKKKDPLPPIIDMDLREKEQKEKENEQVCESVSIAPAIPRITTGRPDTGPLSGMTLALAVLLAVIIILIIVVIVIIVVCRRKH